MRRLITVAAAAAAIVVVGAGAYALAANEYQTTKIKVNKTKLDKKKFAPVGLITGVSTPNNEGSNIPGKAYETVLHFNKNFKFDTRKPVKCTANLEGTTTEQAKALCPKSQVSVDGKNSVAEVKLLPNGDAFPAAVTAFNGPGANQITLHARVTALSATTIIRGTLGKSRQTGYTTQIKFPVPPVGGGAGAISEFYAQIKRGGYVQARCAEKQFKVRAITKYHDHPTSVAEAKQRCTRR